MDKERNKGITLIVLVVTIIVLLILAGVSIAMLTGTNGILTQAKNAKKATEEETENEKRKLSQVEASTHLENYDYTDTEGNIAKIPAGFAVSNVEGENLVSKGLVIIGETGNEYVWIPCTTDEQDTNKVQYKRETEKWGIEDDNGTLATKDELTLTEEIPSEEEEKAGITVEVLNEIVKQIKSEKVSVKNNGGYYIGRYETGKEKNSAVVKQNKMPYREISWSTAYDLARGLNIKDGATSYLCSSYAWDTAVNFIEKNSIWTNYGASREDTNENWLDKEVKDKNENVIKQINSAKLLNTGLTTAKLNIFDLAGNASEYTTEILPNTGEEAVIRAGAYYDLQFWTLSSAGYRWDTANKNLSKAFRVTLFLN